MIFGYKKLKQRCEDLELILMQYIQQKEVSSFEMDLFVRMFNDPITYQVEASEHEKRLYEAITRLQDIEFELSLKESLLRAGKL